MKTIAVLLRGRAPLQLAPNTTVLEAARAMTESHVGAVLVVDDWGKPLGIFTERDLMTRIVVPRRNPDQVRVQEVMTGDLFTATPDTPLASAREQLQARHVRHLPVVRDGRVVEMLSLRDILRADLEETAHELDDLTHYIQGQGEVPG
jgi:CBS domain-containing protein